MKQRLASVTFAVIGLVTCIIAIPVWLKSRTIVSQRDVTLSSPIPVTQSLLVLSGDNITNLKEINAFSLANSSISIEALFLPSDKEELLIVSAGDHYLRRWNMTTEALVTQFDLHTVDPENISFSPDGKLVGTVRSIWNTVTGDLVECDELPDDGCPPTKLIGVRYLLHPDAVRYYSVVLGNHLVGLGCLQGDCAEYAYPLSGPDDVEGTHGVYKMVLDDSGDYAATAFETGLVRIWRVSNGGFGLVSTLKTDDQIYPKIGGLIKLNKSLIIRSYPLMVGPLTR